MARRGYPGGLRRRVIEPVESRRQISELAVAAKRIRELDEELAIHHGATAPLEENGSGPRGSSRRSK